MKKLLALLLTCSSLSLFAQNNGLEIKAAAIDLDSRTTALPQENILRLQERVRMGFTIDAFGVVDIVGLATTGQGFNNTWSTVLSNTGTDKIELAFRNIYATKTMGKTTIEAGALPYTNVVGIAGLSPNGWIDGVRLKAKTQVGEIKVTAGSLGNFQEPNAFKRKFDGNFIELEFDKKIFEKILTSTALEVYNGEVYVREEIQFDLKILGEKVFRVFADALYDVERQATNYDIGAEFDVLKTIVNKFENRVSLRLYMSHVDSNIPNRLDMMPSYQGYGTRFSAQLGGQIDKKGNIYWFTRASIGQNTRYDVGLNIKIPYKNTKKDLPTDQEKFHFYD